MRNVKFNWMWLLCVVVVSMAGFIAVANAAPLATTIFQDGFTVDGVNRQYGNSLNGVEVEGSMLEWIATQGLVFANVGGQDVVQTGSVADHTAVIDTDLSLIDGQVKIEADVMTLGLNPTYWVAVGFTPDLGVAGGSYLNAGLWMIVTGEGSYYVFRDGVNNVLTNGGPVTGFVAGEVLDMSMTYDNNTNVVTCAILGQQILSMDLSATDFPGLVKRPFLCAIDSGQHIDSFTVSTDTVPPALTLLEEPRDDVYIADVNSLEMSWLKVYSGEGLTYNVYMDPNETKVTNKDLSAKVASGLGVYSYVPTVNYETTYYWCIETNVDGDPNYTTEVRSFIVGYENEHWAESSWTNDADSGISVGKNYTHKVNFNSNELFTTVINGAAFENDSDRIAAGGDWTLDDPISGAGGLPNNVVGNGAQLLTNFWYDPDKYPVTLTLTDLTAGQDYILTLYNLSVEGVPGARVSSVTTSADGRTVRLDQCDYPSGAGKLFKYSYTAPPSGELAVTFEDVSYSWIHYAFSNEMDERVYVDPTPLPGANIEGNVLLEWTLSGTVTNPTYNVTIATDETMTTVVDGASGLTATSFSPIIAVVPDSTYYWQVQVVEDGSSVIYTSPVFNYITSPLPDAELVVEWKFEETQGTIAEQTGPSQDADGILIGYNDANTVRVPGLVGNALTFNGSDEYVDISDAESYLPIADEQSFTVSGYFRTFKDTGPVLTMRNSIDAIPVMNITIGYDGVQTYSGQLLLLVRDDEESISWTNSGITVNDGRWHSFIVSRSDGDWSMYIDGVERASLTQVATGGITPDLLAIGTEMLWNSLDFPPYGPHVRFFEGEMDEIAIWSGSMPPSQVAALAAIVPPAADLDMDMDVDIDDLKVLAGDWLDDSYTAVQAPVTLEDMESYTSGDPNSHWVPVVDETLGVATLTVQGDPNYPGGEQGLVLHFGYDFDGKTDVKSKFSLLDRRMDFGLYDTLQITARQLAGSNTTGDLYMDFYDGRGNIAPADEELHYKGQFVIPLSSITDEWTTFDIAIPDDFVYQGWFVPVSPKFCHDLYQCKVGVYGGEGTGTLLIDTIEVIDGTEDCILKLDAILGDLNGDCVENMEDFALLGLNWLVN